MTLVKIQRLRQGLNLVKAATRHLKAPFYLTIFKDPGNQWI